MNLYKVLRNRVVRASILVLALVAYGTMTGCERKVIIDRDHPDWHHDHY